MAQLMEQLEVFGPKLIAWMQGFFEGVWRLLRTGKLADFFDNWLFYAFVLALGGFLLDQVLYFWRHGESTLPVKIWQFIAEKVRKVSGARQAAYEQGEESLYEEDEPQTQRREAEAAFWSAARTILRPRQEENQMDEEPDDAEPLYEEVYDEDADPYDEAQEYGAWDEEADYEEPYAYTDDIYDDDARYEQTDELWETAVQEEWDDAQDRWADDLTQQAEEQPWAQPEQLAWDGADLAEPAHTVRAGGAEVLTKEESTDV